MKRYDQQTLITKFAELGYQWPKFHLIGVRSKADIPDAFDDLFYLISGVEMKVYTGTTNPGVYWQQNFGNRAGVAVLKPGQYLSTWTLGKHHGEYLAWTQAKPVTVYRDADRDGKSEAGPVEETGLFGINIHRAHAEHTSTVNAKWSAGCGVFNNPVEFNEFITLSQKSGQHFFTYTLLDEF